MNAGALTAAEAQAATQTALLGKLEEDLAAATVAFAAGSSIHHDSSKEQNEEGAGGAVVAAATAAKGEGSGEVNMAALLLSASVSTTPSTAGSSSSSSYHHNLLPILQAQRDRYKARVRVLEHEMEALTATVARERAATVAAKRDNLALYEKIRFLQAYGNGKGGADVEAGGSGGLVMAAAGKAEARCRPVYEEQVGLGMICLLCW